MVLSFWFLFVSKKKQRTTQRERGEGLLVEEREGSRTKDDGEDEDEQTAPLRESKVEKAEEETQKAGTAARLAFPAS